MTKTPQFGRPEPGRDYRDRPAAFGICDRDNRIAVVEVAKPGHEPWYDLPGGALEPGETAGQAVVREFGEETGLVVEAGEPFAAAGQYFVNTNGEALNNRCAFFALDLKGEDPSLKIEADHTLVWMPPEAAMAELRHEAHAWAVHTLLQRLLLDG
jgi:8-oxo-dGTP diphosphatase